MESSQIIRDFVLNVQRIQGANKKEQDQGAKWMNEFKLSDQALSTCYQILNSAVNDNVKIHSVKTIQKIIKLKYGKPDEMRNMEIYIFFIELIKKSRNSDIIGEICTALVMLFTQEHLWKVTLSQMLNNILSSQPNLSMSCSIGVDDCSPVKTAIIIMGKLFSNPTVFGDDCGKITDLRSKVLHDCESIDKIICDLMNCFREDPFLDEIIDVYILKSRIFPSKNIFECKIFLMICDILRKTEPEDLDRAYTCVWSIKTCIRGFEVTRGSEIEAQYRFFASLVKDFRKFIEVVMGEEEPKAGDENDDEDDCENRIDDEEKEYDKDDNGNDGETDNENCKGEEDEYDCEEGECDEDDDGLVISITHIVVRLAVKFFETYVNSTHEDDFIFGAELSFIGEFNNIDFYNEITEFWLAFESYIDLKDKPKFKYFAEKHCPIFVSHTLRALFVSESMMNEGPNGSDYEYIYEIRDNMKHCLRTVFKLIPIQPYLNNAVLSIKSNPCDYSRIESCLFFISGMITNSPFSVDFNEVLKLIINIKPDAPSLLLETCCQFLKKFVQHFPNHQKISCMPVIGLDSIYKWLAIVPGSTSKLTAYDKGYYVERSDEIISDIEYINNILVFCDEMSAVENLAKFMLDVILNSTLNDDIIFIFEAFVNFYSTILLRDFENTPNQSDSARLALVIMTAFAIVTKGMFSTYVCPDELPIFKKALVLCFKVIDNLKENEPVCENTCEVLYFIINASEYIVSDIENLSEQLLKLYQTTGFSCFITPFLSFLKVCERDACHWKWFLKNCGAIFDQACNFLAHEDLNNHPLLVQRLMKLLQTVLEKRYDTIMNDVEIGKLLNVATQGLLSQDEHTFNECHHVLIEIFVHPSISICKKRPETDSILVNLYNYFAHRIVKNCIEVILTTRNTTCTKGCGDILRIMNSTEKSGILSSLKIEKGIIQETLENYPMEIKSDKNIFDNLTNIFNASSKTEAEDLAASINSKL